MNTSKIDRYDLKQYTRLTISFFLCLLLLSIYQYTFLYLKGVVEMIFSGSFFIAGAQQLGFACLVALILVFPFNFLENLRPRHGFNITFVILALLLVVETILITHYCIALAPVGVDFNLQKLLGPDSHRGMTVFGLVLGTITVIGLFKWFYRLTSKYYHRISKMYPFTIVLFSLFISTLFLDGKPINENKTQHLVANLYKSVQDAKEHKKKSPEIEQFTDGEMVWITSLYNGHDLDNYFLIARDFAFEKEYDKALLLGRYILSIRPDHIDTQILMGRTQAWAGNYKKAEEQLKSVIKNHPQYKDGYSALLDVLFWSDQNHKVDALYTTMKRNKVLDAALLRKIERSKQINQRTAAVNPEFNPQ